MLIPITPLTIPGLSALMRYAPLVWLSGVVLLWSTRYTHSLGQRWGSRYYLLSSLIRPAGIALISLGWLAVWSAPHGGAFPWELGFRPVVTWLPHKSILDVFCWLAGACFTGLFAWSVAVLGVRKSFLYRHADDGLVTSGPYALVRHPQFLASIGATSSFSLLCAPNWYGLANCITFAVALWALSILEETELRAHFGEQYEAYARRTPRLFPN